MHQICFVYIFPHNSYRELNSFEETCFTLVATITRELNPTEVGKHIYIYIYIYMFIYNYMDAPRGRWLSVPRKSKTAIAEECYEPYWTNPGGNIPKKSSCTTTYLPSRKPSKLNEKDMRDTAEEIRTNSWTMYYFGPLHTDKQVNLYTTALYWYRM